jgi:citrate lyase beta subunit
VLREMLLANAESVVMAVIKAAKEGDMAAAKLIVDRVLPKRLCRPLDGLLLPSINSVADACRAMEAITNAVLAGVLSAEEGANLSAMIETYRRTLEVAEVMARVERLERLQVAKSSASKRLAAK